MRTSANGLQTLWQYVAKDGISFLKQAQMGDESLECVDLSNESWGVKPSLDHLSGRIRAELVC